MFIWFFESLSFLLTQPPNPTLSRPIYSINPYKHPLDTHESQCQFLELNISWSYVIRLHSLCHRPIDIDIHQICYAMQNQHHTKSLKSLSYQILKASKGMLAFLVLFER